MRVLVFSSQYRNSRLWKHGRQSEIQIIWFYDDERTSLDQYTPVHVSVMHKLYLHKFLYVLQVHGELNNSINRVNTTISRQSRRWERKVKDTRCIECKTSFYSTNSLGIYFHLMMFVVVGWVLVRLLCARSPDPLFIVYILFYVSEAKTTGVTKVW